MCGYPDYLNTKRAAGIGFLYEKYGNIMTDSWFQNVIKKYLEIKRTAGLKRSTSLRKQTIQIELISI